MLTQLQEKVQQIFVDKLEGRTGLSTSEIEKYKTGILKMGLEIPDHTHYVPNSYDSFMNATGRMASNKYFSNPKPCDGCNGPRRYSVARGNLTWAVGVTTAPRKNMTLMETINSIRAAGWMDINVFAEPNTDLNGIDAIIHQRSETLGCWRNYVQTMRDLYEKNPKANVILILQDDITIIKDAKEFLEHDLWPSQTTACVSLYSAGTAEADGQLGIIQNTGMIMGACAIVWPRHVVKTILETPSFINDWRGRHNRASYEPDPAKKKATDTWITSITSQMKWKSIYRYVPSMVQHIADTSAVGHGGKEQLRKGIPYRKSMTFPGQEKSAFDLPYGRPFCRWNLPQCHQRFQSNDKLPWAPISAIVPVINAPEMTKKCLNALKASEGVKVHLIYIDNNSDPENQNIMKEYLSREWPDATVIWNKENLGWTKAINQGMEICPSHHHVLHLNNDAYVNPTCLSRLQWHLENHDKVACVGPVTCDGGNQSIEKSSRAQGSGLKIPAEKIKQDPLLAETHCRRGLVTSERMVAGFCQLFHRTAVKFFGGLSDNDGFMHGLGTDDEWCARATKAGWWVLCIHNAFCAHDRSQTFQNLNIDRKAAQKVAIRTLKAVTQSPPEISAIESVEKQSETIDPAQPSEQHPINRFMFRSWQQVQSDIDNWLPKIPEISGVCGIPRSGQIVASMIAMSRNIPCLSLDSLINDLPSFRTSCSRKLYKSDGPVLVVDDTIWKGRTIKEIKNLLSHNPGIIYGAVYASDEHKQDVDVYGYILPHWTHSFPWNLLRDAVTTKLAIDFDGVLCPDWEGSDEGDRRGEYEKWLSDVKPMYLPTKPVGAIITGRRERYRPVTLDWLKRYGVKCRQLIMYPGDEKRDHVEHKAKHLINLAQSGIAGYVESCPVQARQIAEKTGLPVMSFSEGICHNSPTPVLP